ncbi:MAG TPA: hypothetical protein PL009_13505 [Flavipsychrobacter sp.]|nr:hypothetical protein [Flavipsychrobacter sp.]
MPAINETGHAVNVSNFRLIIDHCVELGGVYAPTNAAISIANMNALHASAETAIAAVNTTSQQAKGPINAREEAYEELEPLVTRAFNFYASTNASEQAIADAKGLADKIRGVGVVVQRDAEGNPDPNHVSNSHQSYVQRLNHFRQLIALLVNDDNYAPSEDALGTDALTVLANTLETRNEAVGPALAAAIEARGSRDVLLYADETGMLDLVQKVKKYCKSLPPAQATLVKAILGIKFKKIG